MHKRNNILITGSSGLIGQILLQNLPLEHTITGLDITESSDDRTSVANLQNLNEIKHHYSNVDTVIDLAGISNLEADWNQIYSNNIPVTYNSFEAAKQSNVKRIIYASSNHVTGLYEYETPYSDIISGNYHKVDHSKLNHINSGFKIKPDSPYGIGKSFGESVAKYYSEKFGISVICLRIGTVNKYNRPMDTRQFATLLTHRDLVQLVSKSINAKPNIKYEIFYGVSNNKWRIWDLTESAAKISYEPRDSTESHRCS